MQNKKDFICLKDMSQEEILRVIGMALELKFDRTHSMELLKGKTIGLVFQKPSNRTRVSFEVGVFQMSGNCVYLGPEEINLGVREKTSDVAKTLSRYVDGIVARTHTHEDIVELAAHATVPVINGLSDLYHPCQALTDIFSIKEKFSKLENLTLAYVGDGNNVCHSLLIACSKVGMNMRVATPPGYEPHDEVLQVAQGFAKKSNTEITCSHDPIKAVNNAEVIYSDVWVSMGQEKESENRLNDFKEFQINQELCNQAKENYIFMHCLPAHRGQEVTDDVIDGNHSIVFDQAENRLHTQKAILNLIYHHW